MSEAVFPYGGRMKNPKTIKCHCGSEVELTDALTNECDGCGQLYNGGGQQLRPVEEWEENWDED
jgi:hypothetical protein